MPDSLREKTLLAGSARLKVVNDREPASTRSATMSFDDRNTDQSRISSECAEESAEEPPDCKIDAHLSESATSSGDPHSQLDPQQLTYHTDTTDTFLAYQLISVIEENEASIAYKAKTLSGERFYSLRVLKSTLSPEEAIRFTQRNRLLTQLDHANLISMYDVGVLPDGTPYMVSELVEGMTLDEHLTEQGAPAPDLFFDLFSQICSALQFCHERKLIHGHLSPSTVRLIRCESGGFSVKLESSPAWSQAEFEPDYASINFAEKNIPQSIIHSLAFRSPEQFLDHPIGVAADVYAVGAMMYKAVSGRPPLESEDPLKLLLKIANVVPPPLRNVPGVVISAELQRIIMCTLEKDASKRPFCMKELAEDLACAAGIKKRSNWQAFAIAVRMMMRPKLGPDNKNRPDRVALALIVVASLAFLAAVLIGRQIQDSPVNSSVRLQHWVDKAELAMIHHDFQKVAYMWRLALGEAEASRKLSDQELGNNYMRAGDAVLSDVSMNFTSIPGGVSSIPACGYGVPVGSLSPEEVLRFSCAEEFYDRGVAYLGKEGKLNSVVEQFDRLIDLKRAKRDQINLERLLLLRIDTVAPGGVLSVDNYGATQELANLYAGQGKFQEAAKYYERALAINKLPSGLASSSYDRIDTRYGRVLAKLNRFKEAEDVCLQFLKKQVLDRRDFTNALDVMRDFSDICADSGYLQRANVIREKVKRLQNRPPYKESDWIVFD